MNYFPEIKQLHYKRRDKCGCVPKCEVFYKVDGFSTYCKKGLQQFAIDILNITNGTNISQGNYNNRGWTTKQEIQLIQYIQNNGVQFGTYRILAEMFGKNREQVKRKVYKLEKEGRLVRPS